MPYSFKRQFVLNLLLREEDFETDVASVLSGKKLFVIPDYKFGLSCLANDYVSTEAMIACQPEAVGFVYSPTRGWLMRRRVAATLASFGVVPMGESRRLRDQRRGTPWAAPRMAPTTAPRWQESPPTWALTQMPAAKLSAYFHAR